MLSLFSHLNRLFGYTAVAAASLLGAHSATAAEMRLVEGRAGQGVSIEIRGAIVKGDADRLAGLVRSAPRGRPEAVVLNSPGGSIGEALQMGRYFRANGITTMVRGNGAHCLSACALAFLGGRDASGALKRVKGAGAQIGYHAFRREVQDKDFTTADMREATARSQDILLAIADYLVDVQADIEFMSMMLEAPHNAMTYLANDKALRLGVHVLDERSGRLSRPFAGEVTGARTP